VWNPACRMDGVAKGAPNGFNAAQVQADLKAIV
jgi:hypothetical protein